MSSTSSKLLSRCVQTLSLKVILDGSRAETSRNTKEGADGKRCDRIWSEIRRKREKGRTEEGVKKREGQIRERRGHLSDSVNWRLLGKVTWMLQFCSSREYVLAQTSSRYPYTQSHSPMYILEIKIKTYMLNQLWPPPPPTKVAMQTTTSLFHENYKSTDVYFSACFKRSGETGISCT